MCLVVWFLFNVCFVHLVHSSSWKRLWRTSPSSWQRKRSYPSAVRSLTYRCISSTRMQKSPFTCSQLFGRSLPRCCPHRRVCVCTHKRPWCSLNRSYVIRCEAWAYCLELLWQKDWNHSLGPAVATSQWLTHRSGASMKTVRANFSSRYWSPAHLDSWQIWFVLLPVFCCWKEVSPWLTPCQY